MSQSPSFRNKQDAAVPVVPTAPYPPSAPVLIGDANNPKQTIRSALSSSPQYNMPIKPEVAASAASTFKQDAAQMRSAAMLSSSLLTGDDSRDAAAAGVTRVHRGTTPHYVVSRAQFSPSQPNNVYACINCISSQQQQQQQQDTTTATSPTSQQTQRSSSSSTSKRSGPVLLELRQLNLNTRRDSHDDNVEQQLFDTSILAVSQGNPSLGSSVTSTSMAFPSALTPIAKYAPCATGLSTGFLCVHTFHETTLTEQEESNNNDNTNLLSSTVTYFAPRHQRPASAVAWRPFTNSQIALGLVGTSTTAGTVPVSSSMSANINRRNINVRTGSGGGGDREFCCLLWDVTKGTTTAPISKLSHNVGVASLAWLEEGKMLCIGSQFRNVHIYDLRISGTTTAPISAWAHSDAVSGMEVDPHRPEIFATFGRSIDEPVKFWDIRRMDSAVGEIRNATNETVISSIQWSIMHSGILSVAYLGESGVVHHYETAASLARPVLAGVTNVGSPVLDLALYPRLFDNNKGASGEVFWSQQQQVSALYQHRMLVVTGDRAVRDMPTHTWAPLDISRRDGSIVHAFGGALWMRSSCDGPSAMENPTAQHDEDISAQMMRRAKCVRKARYSMDAALNIQMFSKKAADNEACEESNGMLPSCRMLIRLWSWIEHVEKLCMHSGGLQKWPAKGLADSGVWRLLGMDTATNDGFVSNEDVVTFDESLSCNTYDSPQRRVALSACGWVGVHDLDDILADCEVTGKFERAAALAVWHGEIGAAVKILQQGANVIDSKAVGEDYGAHPDGPQSAETLQLVSMCIAGYSSLSPVWRKACLTLLERDDLRGDSANSARVAYLRAVCTFLIHAGTEDGLRSVLHDEGLSVSDRVAFAIRFLDHGELLEYLDGCVSYCRESGNLEGLVVTGVDKVGLKIFQAYVDKYTDVQTAALVCCRTTFSADWERSVCLQWLDAYRGLLNSWQMWQSRAMFDVDVADYLSKLKARQGDEFQSQGGRLINYQGRRMLHASIPAQLEARCNKCSKPLTGLRGRHEGMTSQRLTKANSKPVLSCCPHCGNPLPRCSICLLSLGCLNPSVELKKERDNLPFAEWFTWCMRCKHGGHAHHLVGWFANHDVCPVSGCACRCQFDAMQKLRRRAHGNDDGANDETVTS